MDESKNWLSENFSLLLGAIALGAVVVGALGSAKLDPKADAVSKNGMTIDIVAEAHPRVAVDLPRVPRDAHSGSTFRVIPYVGEIDVPLNPTPNIRIDRAPENLNNLVVEVTPQPNSSSSRPTEQVASTRTYKVRPGDTLTRISRKVYGSSRYWKRIAEANISRIGNYHRLKIGQTLIIPDKNPIKYAPSPNLIAGLSPRSGSSGNGRRGLNQSQKPRTYTVKRDDTWWTLAGKLLGDPTKWKALKKANTAAAGSRVLNIGTTLSY